MAATYPVTFKITTTKKGFNATGDKSTFVPSYRVGQMIFVEDEGKIYLDFHGKRTCYSPIGSVNSMNYMGIASTDPTLGTFNIKGESENFVPRINDMVVFGSKEFLYRKGEDGNLGWFEIGDENAEGTLNWEED